MGQGPEPMKYTNMRSTNITSKAMKAFVPRDIPPSDTSFFSSRLTSMPPDPRITTSLVCVFLDMSRLPRLRTLKYFPADSVRLQQ